MVEENIGYKDGFVLIGSNKPCKIISVVIFKLQDGIRKFLH